MHAKAEVPRSLAGYYIIMYCGLSALGLSGRVYGVRCTYIVVRTHYIIRTTACSEHCQCVSGAAICFFPFPERVHYLLRIPIIEGPLIMRCTASAHCHWPALAVRDNIQLDHQYVLLAVNGVAKCSLPWVRTLVTHFSPPPFLPQVYLTHFAQTPPAFP
jgi:hypothetical protein